MVRYFFDIDDGSHRTHDSVGTELPDRESARRQAISVLPDIAREELPDGNDHVFSCSIRDNDGAVIFLARLALHAAWQDDQGATGT